MASQIDIIWLASVAACGWIGHRLAAGSALNPYAGLLAGVAVNVALVIDPTRLFEPSRDTLLLLVYLSILAFLWFWLLIGRHKMLALVKVGAGVAALALLFSALPRDFYRGFGLGEVQASAEPIAAAALPRALLAQAWRADMGFGTVARVRGTTALYVGVFSEPRESGRGAQPGEWVLVNRQVKDSRGQDWTEVILADAEGEYKPGRSRMGFVPSESLAFYRPTVQTD